MTPVFADIEKDTWNISKFYRKIINKKPAIIGPFILNPANLEKLKKLSSNIKLN